MNMSSFFYLCIQGASQCQQLFDLGTFEKCFQLLTGFSLSEVSAAAECKELLVTAPSCQDLEEVDKSKQKKWTSSQSREFSELFTLLAYLVHCCDTSPHLTHSKYNILTVIVTEL